MNYRSLLCQCLDIPESSDDSTIQSTFDEQVKGADEQETGTEADAGDEGVEDQGMTAAEPADTVNQQANSPVKYKSRAMAALKG